MRSCFVLILLANVLLAERPNIILVLTDDQGIGDVGIHGNDKIRTPTIDEFAKDGIQMTRFYVEPVCAPTRAALMTGRYHYRTGVIHTSRGGAKMAGDEKTIAEFLREVGYQTGIFGKWHLGDNYPMRPQDQGFAETLVHKSGGIGQTPDKPNSYFEPWLWQNGRKIRAQGYCTDIFFDAAIEFIENNASKSFFVYLPLNAPHTPLEIADRYVANYRAMGLNETTAKVYGMIENIDGNFARLLKRLDSLGLRENTVVIFMTDNGAQQARYNAKLRGRKSHTYEGGIRVPFFLQWPGRLPRPNKFDALTAHIDLLPTLLEMAEYQGGYLKPFDGRSFFGLLQKGKSIARDRSLVFQVHRGLQPHAFQNSAVVSQRYKLVGYPGTFGQETLKTDPQKPQLELYDLKYDPTEQDNIAEEKPDLVRKLAADYRKWFASVQSSRKFAPGKIHIGNPAENPSHLCRYQDATFEHGKPKHWEVRIETAGRYRISVNAAERTGGRIHVNFNGQRQSRPVLPGGNSATFSLPAGEGTLDVWFVPDGKHRVIVTNNSPTDDVTLALLN